MRSAIRSFIGILVLISGIGLFAWVVLKRSDAVRETPSPMAHPFLKAAPARDVVAYHVPAPTSRKVYSHDHLSLLRELPEEVVLWIEVRQRLDGTLVAALNEAEVFDAPLFKDVLPELGRHRLILNFRGNREGSYQRFAQVIDEAHAGDRVLIQSPEDGFLKDLRAAHPLWIYGTSMAQVTRMIMLSSIGLASLAPLKGDVVVVESPPKEHLLDRLSDDVIVEAHRRRMKIYAGPADAAEATRLWNRGIDGVLTSQPDAVLRETVRR